MDKQIEENGKELYNDLSSIMSEEYEKRMLITPSYCANKMLEKGYRKIPEDAVVLTQKELIEMQLKYYNGGAKGTAEKFAERLKTELREWLEDNEKLDGTIDFGIAMIELIGVKALDGEVIVESLIDEICKEITEA